MEEVSTGNTNKDPSKLLIKIIKEHPILWNRDIELYKNKDARENAWSDICREMEPNFENLNTQKKNQLITYYTKKWYNIRDSYRRSFSTKTRHRPYIYKGDLSFMDNYYKNLKFAEEDDGSDEETEQTYSEVFVDTNDIDHEVEVEAKRLKIDEVVKKEISNNLQTDIVTVLSNIINKADDEESSFFRCITSSVKSLSNDSKLEFKIEVLKLIKKLKAKDECETKTKPEYLEESE